MGQRRNHNKNCKAVRIKSTVKHQTAKLWDIANVVLRDTFIILSTVIRNQEEF